MKLALAVVFVLASTLSFNVAKAAQEPVFKKDSHLPAELQALVLEAVRTECSEEIYGLIEDTTTYKAAHVDQGVTDYMYTTWLKGTINFDKVHPVGVDIRVKSAQYAWSNPSVPNLQVLEVASYSGYCRVVLK